MKRAPTPRPDVDRDLRDRARVGQRHRLPDHQDLASLLWVVNLGCIDLNQWYARCDDVDRPDYLHFDLDPGAGATFERVRETALVVRDALDALRMPALVKTTGSQGHARLRADRARADAEGGVDVREGAGAGARRAPSGAHDRGVPDREAARRAACSSTTTRTRGAARSPRSTRCARARVRRSRRPSRGTKLERASTIDDFRIDNVPARVAEARRSVEAAAPGARQVQPRACFV